MTPTHAIDFELSEAALRARRNAKWNQYGPEVLPAWVADMDFAVAAPIRSAVERIVADDDYGYQMRDGERAEQAAVHAFVKRMKSRYDWQVPADLVLPVADLVQGTYAAILAFSDPGDGVILQTPNYPPFREAIHATERRLLPLPMRDQGGRYGFDMDELKSLVARDTRIFLLCNPQNPTGRVFSRDELEALGRFAVLHDLVVLADEIHADLVYPGQAHIPFASLGPEIAARTVTLTSATKSFNIPGLRCALMAFGSEDLKRRFHNRIPSKLTGSVNIVGIDATVAAWTDGQPWLDAVMGHLLKARNRVAEVLTAEIPEILFHPPEATYLGWLDCTKLRLSSPAFKFFHDNARVGLSAGETFDPACAQFVRLNFATSMPILNEILDRMITATRQNDR